MEGWVTLVGLKNSGTDSAAVRNLDSTREEHTHTLAYSWNMVKEADWNCLGLWPASCNHPSTGPSQAECPLSLLALRHSSTLGQRLPQLRKLLICEGWRWLRPDMASEQNSHYWCSQKQQVRSYLGLWPGTAPAHIPTLAKSPLQSLVQALLLSGTKLPNVERGNSTHSEGTKSAQTRTSGLLLYQLWTWPYTPYVSIGHWA